MYSYTDSKVRQQCWLCLTIVTWILHKMSISEYKSINQIFNVSSQNSTANEWEKKTIFFFFIQVLRSSCFVLFFFSLILLALHRIPTKILMKSEDKKSALKIHMKKIPSCVILRCSISARPSRLLYIFSMIRDNGYAKVLNRNQKHWLSISFKIPFLLICI